MKRRIAVIFAADIAGYSKLVADNEDETLLRLKLRALAVTTTTRWEGLLDIPTVGDSLPGFEASTWFGLGASRGVPAEIIEKLNREINAALADPKMKARLADLGGAPLVLSPAEFGKLIADETEKWGKVIRAANIKPE